MESHGLQVNLMDIMINFTEQYPMETVPSWWWVKKELSLPHRMAPLGLKGLQEKTIVSMESPLGEAHSPCPLGKTIPLLRDRTERIFRIGKPESVGTP